MSSDNCTRKVMGYGGCCAPPADHDQWADLLADLGRALVGRYGAEQASAFRFEIWNELDCLNSSQYAAIYAAAARGLKRASAVLAVGGPATNCGNGWSEPEHPQEGRSVESGRMQAQVDVDGVPFLCHGFRFATRPVCGEPDEIELNLPLAQH